VLQGEARGPFVQAEPGVDGGHRPSDAGGAALRGDTRPGLAVEERRGHERTDAHFKVMLYHFDRAGQLICLGEQQCLAAAESRWQDLIDLERPLGSAGPACRITAPFGCRE
jgi:hypothetical protein